MQVRADPVQGGQDRQDVRGQVLLELRQLVDEPDRRGHLLVAELFDEPGLWVLWTDYFKPEHFEKYPNLHTLFNEATKLSGGSGAKGSVDPAVADKLLQKIDEISKIFWETK
ncbi:superoxide dismutase [Ni], partial [Micromonospora sp. ATA51]|uniref:superoxide dismutase [Ni] n=1 Tax=Micromonospora sp. ATA51 TaxID=2806098 RepID=UPI001A638AFC|nr:superoxide dismutase, Ni [Micromonospora sp. ATA51]